MNWRTSSYTGEGNCVEVGASAPVVAVRDTKQEGMPQRDILKLTLAAWTDFTRKLKTS
jgi:hypothetical protein